MKVLIGADFVPTTSNEDFFAEGKMEKLLGEELFKIIQKVDYRIINLEVPLTDKICPIEKKGPNLYAKEETINGLKEVKIDLASLANNHILDQGEYGVSRTIELLEANKIAYVGAGETLNKANKPYYFQCAEKIIGIYACCEHEFSVATEQTAGANPIDVFNSFECVCDMRKKCDYIIVLYHGGREHYRYPTPFQQKVMRKFVDVGADIVIAQHSHCVGCEETYKDKKIVYGQGNFLFDYEESECWKTGLLIELEIGQRNSVNYIPVVKDKNKVRLAEKEESLEIMKGFQERSIKILENNSVKDLFEKEALENQAYYLRMIRGNSFLEKVLAKILRKKYMHYFCNSYARTCIYDVIACESHRDILLAFLDKFI